ncbi:MAG: PP2C family protein-serine/threonine phosphatase [Actinomycetes bacterium]
MTIRLRYAAVSDVGMVRRGNEDSGYAGPNLLVIADGMGGHAAGEVASAVVVDSVRDLPMPTDSEDPAEVLRTGVAQAGERLRQLVETRPELEGMGTTLTMLRQAGGRVAIAQVGDSRGYLLRDGVLEQLTHDQTFVQTLVDQGRISDAEALTHPQRSLLLQALDGRVEVEPVVLLRSPHVGDRYLLCSDGLSSVVSGATLRDVLAVGTPQEAAERLVDLALRAGAPDNVTVLVADVVEEDDDVAAPAAVTVGAASDSPYVAGARPGEAAVGEPSAGAEQDREVDVEADREGDDDADGGDGGRPGRAGRAHSLRLMVPVALLLLVTGLAAWGGYRWTQTQYYVGVHDGEVVIYQGVPQRIVGRSLSTVLEPSGVQAAALPSFSQDQVSGTIPAASLDEARRIVTRLQVQVIACASTPTPDGCPQPSSSASPGATAAASPSVSP